MKVTKLLVYPNPYVGIHRLQGPDDGVTWSGTFPMEPDGPGGYHGQLPRYIGCKVDDENTTELSSEKTLTVKRKTAVLSYAQHDVAYKYEREPVSVPNTQYYRDAVFRNDLTGHSGLIAADLDTARACGINADQFKDPFVILEELRLDAIKRFVESNSDITLAEAMERLPSPFGPAVYVRKPPTVAATTTDTKTTSNEVTAPAKGTDGGKS